MSLSTLHIYFYKTVSENTVTTSYGRKVINALKGGWQGISKFVLLLLYAWPFLILVGGLIYFLVRWAKRNDVSCLRLYDADLPEFAFALDAYTNALNPDQVWYHLQEYQAPKTIDADKAARRIQIAQMVVKKVFALDDSLLFCKLRQRQRGKEQYQKQDKQGELFQVKEGAARFLINLSDYLDTGLFLDHRLTRQRVMDLAKDQKVLNLFCYTASVSVQAALGGAREVVSAERVQAPPTTMEYQLGERKLRTE